MATMIVAIHTKAFEDVAIINHITAPFMSAAVPVFFILSSFFLFRKMETKGYSWDIYLPFLKRLLILYGFWLIVTLPTTLYTKWNYWDYGFPRIVAAILRDLFFCSTFPGSWFLTALVVGTFLIFLLKKYLKASSAIILSLSVIIYVYISIYSKLPHLLQKPYLFIQTNIRDVVELTPITGFIWCAVGCVLTKNNLMGRMADLLSLAGCVLAFIISYCARVFLPEDLTFIAKPFLVLSIIMLAYLVRLKPSGVYLRLRNMSILIYLIHFQMLYLIIFLPNDTLNIVYYIVVLFTSLIIASIILRLENNKLFRFLKYSH